ncbi:flagellar assembly protein FliH [Ruminiclostridium sufflavum DSM 19573]|uniref:Flagellar assembly protein FliH n=1 Tax=Ruminiclostridium sufflavum DSM 19573 TaxID=1121337 RepID=A0A318XTK6_9FIRM|nr:FliH/SctL family protein [Ruminiclostridium sufflavum]PYG89819.1 flagellar assembly protein FliH [Ruminiclostridium sufflavum DSM 19573]
MSNNKVFKNHQINVGMPFQVLNPMTYQPPVVRIKNADEKQPEELENVDYKAIGEEIVNKAKEEADFIVREALLEAKEIISKSSIEIEELKNKVIFEAKEEGYAEGIAQAKQEYEHLIEEAQGIKEQAGVEYQKVLNSLETDAVNTILEIARKVISQEVKCKQNILLLVREAFEKCSKDSKAILRISEQDYDYINENKDELFSMLQRSEETEIKKDLSLKEGGCVIDTSLGSIDAGVDTKLDKLESDFRAVLGERLA